MVFSQAHFKNTQEQGVKSRKLEAYSIYDKSLSDADNAVIEYFRMCAL